MIQQEPLCVANDRILITETFKDLVFIEEGHKYYRNGQLLPSVSEVTHKYKPEFDAGKVAIGYAKKNGETPEYWLDQWKFKNLKATTTGTRVHEYGEGLFWLRMGKPDLIPDSAKGSYIQDKNWLIPTRPKEEAALKFWNELPNTDFPVLAETKVYNNFNPVAPPMITSYCGTFDILFYRENLINPLNSGYIIRDYKGLDINTPIFTKNKGWITMGTIQKNDLVFDKEGNPCKVLNTSEIHHKPCYKITFSSQNTIICDDEHRWLVQTKPNDKCFREKVMTAKEIYDYFQNTLSKNRSSRNILRIPINKPLSGEIKKLLIDPYVLGVWLGDGDSNSGKITNMYNEIWEEIEKRGFNIGPDVSQGSAGKAKTRTVYKLSSLLRQLNLINNKHIPDEYFNSSYDQRISLLRGFMDTDGSYNKRRKRYTIETTKVWMKNSILQLLGSLGIKCTLSKVVKCATDTKDKKKIPGWNIEFSSNEPYPFLKRNVKIEKVKNFNSGWIIKSIEKVNPIPTRCIEVDSPTHTYLYGHQFIPTHNTNRELYSDYSRTKKKMCLPPFSDFPDESFSMYTLQLGCYQIPLEDLGLNIIGREIIWLKDSGDYEVIQVPDITGRLRNIL